MEIIDKPSCHGFIADYLTAGPLHEDIPQDGPVNTQAHETSQHVPVSDETIPAVPGHRQQGNAIVHRPFIIIAFKGNTDSLRFMETAEAGRRHRLHVGRNGLPDLTGIGRHERTYGKRPSPLHGICQIQQTDGHFFGLIAAGSKKLKDLFSVFHSILLNNLNQ